VATIVRRCHAGLDTTTLLREVSVRLRRLVPFDAGYFGTTDPATRLFTGGILIEQDEADIARFFRNEYLDEDVMKFRGLADRADHVDWLDRATGGARASSSRYREIITSIGMDDELRAAFVGHGACWGAMCVTRERNSPAFTKRDAAIVARLVPHVADGLRTATLFAAATAVEPEPDGPGVVVVNDDLTVMAMTPPAQRWLAELDPGCGPGDRLPFAVCSAVTALHRLEHTDEHGTVQPRARVRTRSGRWLVVHSAFLGDDKEQTAVVLEPANRDDTVPLLLQAFGLTPKEREVIRLVLLGRSTKEISAGLSISDHTVQDHLKSIFEKTGAGSRRELVAQVLHEQYALTP
jgi:DNA-binding CsgD family transcriptional regulator